MKASCPKCLASYNIPDDFVGTKLKCKKCEWVFKVEDDTEPLIDMDDSAFALPESEDGSDFEISFEDMPNEDEDEDDKYKLNEDEDEITIKTKRINKVKPPKIKAKKTIKMKAVTSADKQKREKTGVRKSIRKKSGNQKKVSQKTRKGIDSEIKTKPKGKNNTKKQVKSEKNTRSERRVKPERRAKPGKRETQNKKNPQGKADNNKKTIQSPLPLIFCIIFLITTIIMTILWQKEKNKNAKVVDAPTANSTSQATPKKESPKDENSTKESSK